MIENFIREISSLIMIIIIYCGYFMVKYIINPVNIIVNIIVNTVMTKFVNIIGVLYWKMFTIMFPEYVFVMKDTIE